MATGPKHFAEAVDLLRSSRGITADDLEPAQLLTAALMEAQVQATLALTAATALAEYGRMPGHDFDAWEAVCGTPRSEPGPVWWVDDGQESTDRPPLYTSETVARRASIEQYCQDNPFSDPDSDEVAWLAPEDPEDEGPGSVHDEELAVRGRRTGIFVRPIRPKDGR